MLKYNIPTRKHGNNLADYNLENLFNDLLKKEFNKEIYTSNFYLTKICWLEK